MCSNFGRTLRKTSENNEEIRRKVGPTSHNPELHITRPSVVIQWWGRTPCFYEEIINRLCSVVESKASQERPFIPEPV
jgi:hypothetical protein